MVSRRRFKMFDNRFAVPSLFESQMKPSQGTEINRSRFCENPSLLRNFPFPPRAAAGLPFKIHLIDSRYLMMKETRVERPTKRSEGFATEGSEPLEKSNKNSRDEAKREIIENNLTEEKQAQFEMEKIDLYHRLQGTHALDDRVGLSS